MQNVKMTLYSLLGTLLMALRGRSTRTVRMADKLMFCRSREYSTILGRRNTKGDKEISQRLKVRQTITTPAGPEISALPHLYNSHIAKRQHRRPPEKVWG